MLTAFMRSWCGPAVCSAPPVACCVNELRAVAAQRVCARMTFCTATRASLHELCAAANCSKRAGSCRARQRHRPHARSTPQRRLIRQASAARPLPASAKPAESRSGRSTAVWRRNHRPPHIHRRHPRGFAAARCSICCSQSRCRARGSKRNLFSASGRAIRWGSCRHCSKRRAQ